MRTRTTAALLGCLLGRASPGPAQSQASPAGASILSHVWLSGQLNVVSQGHPSFRSPYAGAKSFGAKATVATSRIATLHSGLRLSERTGVLVSLESGTGSNLSFASGFAGFPNMDTVGIPDRRPYVARALVHHSFRLGGDNVEMNRGPLQLAGRAAARRLDVYAGKLALTDFFDVNVIGGDSHFQFLNWSAGNNAAFGYPSDPRGYTYGIVIEYHRPSFAARFAEALQARADDPNRIDFRIGRSHSEHFEVEVPLQLVPNRAGAVRALSFANFGPLAAYREANAGYLARGLSQPDVAGHRRPRRKFGFGFGVEQEVTSSLRAYARAGWAEGKTESLANTEANSSASAGFDLIGPRWRRPDDKLGVAAGLSGLSRDHRAYLELGGVGAVLGDERLTYGPEKFLEIYYTAKVGPGVYIAGDVQRIWNPGCNRVRGPVLVAAIRLHLEMNIFTQPR